MKIKDIDDWDHFKGDFKGKAADKTEKSLTKDIYDQKISIDFLYAQIEAGMYELSIPKIFPKRNTGINSGVPIAQNIYRRFDKLEITVKKLDMSSMSTKEYEQSICEHDPIDVGFAKVKMACRKCDKDL